MTPIEFARARAPRHETCAGFALRWIEASGVRSSIPTAAEILRIWREDGVIDGARKQFARMKLQPCAPAPNCVAVAEQDGGGPLVGVIDANGAFVTRAFGKMKVSRSPRIVAAWRIQNE